MSLDHIRPGKTILGNELRVHRRGAGETPGRGALRGIGRRVGTVGHSRDIVADQNRGIGIAAGGRHHRWHDHRGAVGVIRDRYRRVVRRREYAVTEIRHASSVGGVSRPHFLQQHCRGLRADHGGLSLGGTGCVPLQRETAGNRLRRCRFGLDGHQEPEAERDHQSHEQSHTGVEPGGILQVPRVTEQSNLLLQPPVSIGISDSTMG